jgi:hypothetical protein
MAGRDTAGQAQRGGVMADVAPSRANAPLGAMPTQPQRRKTNPWLKGCLILIAILVGLGLLAVGICTFEVAIEWAGSKIDASR